MYVLYVLTVQIKSQVGGVHKKNSKSSKFKSLRRTSSGEPVRLGGSHIDF
jgi:hypothetical protein